MRYWFTQIPMLAIVALALAGFLPMSLAAQETTPDAAGGRAITVIELALE